MPQFINDWNNWWMAFWNANPELFWAIVIGCVVGSFIARRKC